jgi:hypothetical protein
MRQMVLDIWIWSMRMLKDQDLSPRVEPLSRLQWRKGSNELHLGWDGKDTYIKS